MPDVDQNPPDSNWIALHDAAMDALVNGSAAPHPQPTPPYPGDHPCAVCGSQLAFTAVGWPHAPQWFCKQHLEEFLCQPLSSRFSKPSVGPEPTAGEKASSTMAKTKTTSSPLQLTLFSDGPTNTG
jgi:hypothetical protein